MPSRHDAEAQFKAASTLAPMLSGSAVMLVARLKVNHANANARLSLLRIIIYTHTHTHVCVPVHYARQA